MERHSDTACKFQVLQSGFPPNPSIFNLTSDLINCPKNIKLFCSAWWNSASWWHIPVRLVVLSEESHGPQARQEVLSWSNNGFFYGEIHQRSQDHYSHTISKNGPLRFNIARKTYRLFVPVTRKCECAGYLAACIPELPIVSPPEGICTASWLHCFILMSIHFVLLLLLSHTSAAKWMYQEIRTFAFKKKLCLQWDDSRLTQKLKKPWLAFAKDAKKIFSRKHHNEGFTQLHQAYTSTSQAGI